MALPHHLGGDVREADFARALTQYPRAMELAAGACYTTSGVFRLRKQ